jgi:hypothetical protein
MSIDLIAKGFITMCDLVNTMHAMDKVSRDDSNKFFYIAALVNKLTLLGFDLADSAFAINGGPTKNLSQMKSVELLPRTLELGLRPVEELIEQNRSRDWNALQFLEKGIIAPLGDLFRVSFEVAANFEQHFIDMTPEQLANAKRPVYEYDPTSERSRVIGYKPVDIDECRKNLEEAKQGKVLSSGVRIATEVGVLTHAVSSITSIYDILRPFVEERVGGEEYIQNFDFLALTEIPPPLAIDEVFSRYICPITNEPIRDPVGDPNGRTLYERAAITRWLRVSQTSPATRESLSVELLVEKPAIRAIIDHRLRMHQERLWDYIEDSQVARAAQAAPPDPVLLVEALREHPE